MSHNTARLVPVGPPAPDTDTNGTEQTTPTGCGATLVPVAGKETVPYPATTGGGAASNKPTCEAGGCDRTVRLRDVTAPADTKLLLCPGHWKHYWGVSS